jgi:3-oxoacyl-[acyl-carrier-protein] synthase III
VAAPHLPPAHGVGLSRVVVRLPGLDESVDDILARAGYGPRESRMFQVQGVRRSPTLAPGETLEDQLVAAGRAALGGGGAGLVLYGHTLLLRQLDLGGELRDRLRGRLGLPGSSVYGVSHVNCVSVLRSVELARRYLERPGAAPGDRVLVLGGDQASVNDFVRIFPGMSVSGDSVAAFLVHGPGAGRPRYRYLGGAAGREPRFHRSRRMSPQDVADYPAACRTQAVDTVRRAAADAGLELEQIDWLMPQLSNRMLWTGFSRQSGFPWERICLDLLPVRGHNFGTDALMALEHAEVSGRLRPGDRCALFAIGRGAYFQCVVVEVQEDS